MSNLITRVGLSLAGLATASVLSLGAALPAEATTPKNDHRYSQSDWDRDKKHDRAKKHDRDRDRKKCVKLVWHRGHVYKIHGVRYHGKCYFPERKRDRHDRHEKAKHYGGWYEVRW